MNKKKMYVAPVTELVDVCGNTNIMQVEVGHYQSANGKNLDGTSDYNKTGGLTPTQGSTTTETPTDEEGVPILGAKRHAWSDWE